MKSLQTTGASVEALGSEEFRIFRFLETERPELAAPFLKAVGAARRDVTGRLLECALREDLGGLASKIEADGGFASLPLGTGRLVFRVAAVHAFRRFAVEEVRFAGEDEERRVERPSDLIALLKNAVDSTLAWDLLQRELANSAANLALARAFYGQRKGRLRELAASLGARDALDLARRESPALFFEGLCVEGHNLHPSSKTKTGLDPRAVLRHSPEMDGDASLRLVAVRRDLAVSASVDGKPFDEVLFSRLPGVRDKAESELAKAGLRPRDYTFVLVHPWQFERVLPGVYAGEIARRDVVPFPGVSVPASSTSSFRTVLLRDADLAVKVSVSSRMTSTVRSISAQTARNAPEFTRVMDEALAREPALAESFVPIRELVGVHFAGDAEEKRRSLSAVLREGMEHHLSPGDLPIVGCALYAESPVTGKSVLAELIEAYRRSTGSPSLGHAAFRFVSEYARIVVPGFLTMMSVYGVGLEGHLQNCVPVFEDGRPVRLLFRDWGGARIHAGRLRASGIEADFAPCSLTPTDSTGEMRRKVFYTVFQNHLGEVVLQTAKYSGVPENELWREIRRASEETFHRLALRPALARQTASDREALLAPITHHKALATMRLQPERGDIYTEVPNSLHAA
ncbi:MAG: IucA/IucC family protein [Rubrobacteraceae bacterium]